MGSEAISVFFEAITACAATAAAIIAGVTLTKSQKDQKDGLERQKKQATIDAYNKLQEQVLDKINEYKPAEIRKIAKDKQSEEYGVIGRYLARIEHFCVGLTNGIYDYETFYALAHGYFDSEQGLLMPRLLPMIEKKSEDSDVDYFENLHKVWKEMKAMEEEKSHKDTN